MVIKKHPLQSKTLIVNVISLIAILIQAQTGFIVDMEIQASILAVANTVLRFFTDKPIINKPINK